MADQSTELTKAPDASDQVTDTGAGKVAEQTAKKAARANQAIKTLTAQHVLTGQPPQLNPEKVDEALTDLSNLTDEGLEKRVMLSSPVVPTVGSFPVSHAENKQTTGGRGSTETELVTLNESSSGEKTVGANSQGSSEETELAQSFEPEAPARNGITREVGGQIIGGNGVNIGDTPERTRALDYYIAVGDASRAEGQSESEREANMRAIIDDAHSRGVSSEQLRQIYQERGAPIPESLKEQSESRVTAEPIVISPAPTPENPGNPENKTVVNEARPAVPPAPVIPIQSEQAIEQQAEAELAKDQKYVDEKQAVEKESERWKDINNASQDQQDEMIRNLSKRDKKAYDAYTQRQNKFNLRTKEEVFKLREGKIESLPQAEQAKERKKLEEDLRKARVDAGLKDSSQYQDLQRRNRVYDQGLRALKDEDGQFIYSPEQIRALGNKEWKEVRDIPSIQKIFGTENAGKKAFEQFKFDRAKMNEMEDGMKNKVNYDRLNNNIAPDGTKIPDTPEGKKKREDIIKDQSAARVSDAGPGRVRRGWNGVNRWINNWFGKEPTREQGKKALDYSKDLLSNYGLRGLFGLNFLLPKDKREQARILGRLRNKAMGLYLFKSGLRLAPRLIFLSAVFWLLLPVVIGKGLDMVKPFGGGQNG